MKQADKAPVRGHQAVQQQYAYDSIVASEQLRSLDAIESAMERTNRNAAGAGGIYSVLGVRGSLGLADLRRAVAVLARRHPMMHARIGVDPKSDQLVFGTSGAAVPVVGIDDEPDAWVDVLRRDMNAGATDARGPLFAFALLGRGLDAPTTEERTLIAFGHHAATDGVSLAAVLHELLEELAKPRAWAPAPPDAIRSPLTGATDPQQRQQLDALGVRVRSMAQGMASLVPDERERLLDDLERLEQRLPLGVELSELHRWIALVESADPDRVLVGPDAPPEPGTPVRTGLVVRRLSPEVGRALASLARARGSSIHAVVSAAVLIAYARRHWAMVGAATPGSFPLLNAVSLRDKLRPPLPAHHLRMAATVALTHTRVAPGDRIWEIAGRAGEAIASAVERHRPLTGWFREEAGDRDEIPTSVPLVILSNVGRLPFRSRYGELELREVYGGSVCHGISSINISFGAFGEGLFLGVHYEEPTIGGASIEGFADVVIDVLSVAAQGGGPTAAL
ncbi:MAG: hypothetical protein AAGF11_40595 [Myxococcota bacterium]